MVAARRHSRLVEMPSIPANPRSFPRFGTHASLFAALLAVVTSFGCGGKQRLPVSPVHGQVLYQERGIAGATIIFHPMENVAEAAQKMRPYAYADADGRFQLKTYSEGDGVPSGDYRVSIAFAGAGTESRRDDGNATGAPGSTKAAMSIPLEVRKKYSNVETAGIKVTILDGQNELEPFNLQ